MGDGRHAGRAGGLLPPVIRMNHVSLNGCIPHHEGRGDDHARLMLDHNFVDWPPCGQRRGRDAATSRCAAAVLRPAPWYLVRRSRDSPHLVRLVRHPPPPRSRTLLRDRAVPGLLLRTCGEAPLRPRRKRLAVAGGDLAARECRGQAWIQAQESHLLPALPVSSCPTTERLRTVASAWSTSAASR